MICSRKNKQNEEGKKENCLKILSNGSTKKTR